MVMDMVAMVIVTDMDITLVLMEDMGTAMVIDMVPFMAIIILESVLPMLTLKLMLLIIMEDMDMVSDMEIMEDSDMGTAHTEVTDMDMATMVATMAGDINIPPKGSANPT